MNENVLNKANNISKLHERYQKNKQTLDVIEKIIKSKSGGIIQMYPKDNKGLGINMNDFYAFNFNDTILDGIHKALSIEKNNIESLLSTMLSTIPTDNHKK